MSTAVNKMGSRNDNSGSSTSSGQQLEFTQAMSDFRSMFPTMDSEVIETVLRANRGAVDATIDHLLIISADNEQVGSPNSAAAAAALPKMEPPSYQQAVEEERDLIDWSNDDDNVDSNVGKKQDGVQCSQGVDLLSDELAAMSTVGMSAAAALPIAHSSGGGSSETSASLMPTQQMLQERYELNLKLTEETKPQLLTLDDDDEQRLRIQQQLLEDERLALMMQNQEFMAELRRDQDFMSTLADEELQEQQQQHQTSRPATTTSNAERRSRPSTGLLATMDDNQFREKLRNMGKKSKKRFTQLASMFSRRHNSGKQFHNHDRELLNDQPILPDDDDDDANDDDTTTRPSSGSRWSRSKYTSFQ